MRRIELMFVLIIMCTLLGACSQPVADVVMEEPASKPTETPVANSDTITPELAAPESPAVLEGLEHIVTDVFYDCDLDGDGQTESVTMTYFQNGDEAYDALNVTVEDAGKTVLHELYPGYFSLSGYAYLYPDADGTTVIVIPYATRADSGAMTAFLRYTNGAFTVAEATGWPVEYRDGKFIFPGEEQYAPQDLVFAAPAD